MASEQRKIKPPEPAKKVAPTTPNRNQQKSPSKKSSSTAVGTISTGATPAATSTPPRYAANAVTRGGATAAPAPAPASAKASGSSKSTTTNTTETTTTPKAAATAHTHHSPHHRPYYPPNHPYYYPPPTSAHPPPAPASSNTAQQHAQRPTTHPTPTPHPHYPHYPYHYYPVSPPPHPYPAAYPYPPPPYYYPPNPATSAAKPAAPYPFPYPYYPSTTTAHHGNNNAAAAAQQQPATTQPYRAATSVRPTTAATTTTAAATAKSTSDRSTLATTTSSSTQFASNNSSRPGSYHRYKPSTKKQPANVNASAEKEETTTTSTVSNIVTIPISQDYRMPSAAASLAATNASTKTLPVGANGETTAQNMMEPSLLRLDTLDYDAADEDYIKFVQSLGLQDSESVQLMPEDEDEEEDFQLTNLEDEEEDEEDDEDGDANDMQIKEASSTEDNNNDNKDVTDVDDDKPPGHDSSSTPPPSSPRRKRSSLMLELPEFDPQFYRELEEELGGLEEEDLEAAVASLLGTTSTSYAHAQKHEYNIPQEENLGGRGNSNSGGENVSTVFAEEARASQDTEKGKKGNVSEEDPGDIALTGATTPLRKATGMRTKTVVAPRQVQRLQTLLNRHYQVLVQQAVLSIQAAHEAKTSRVRDKTDFLSLEATDDLVQVLDAAVGMVQDLDQNRKDAIRNAVQFEETNSNGAAQDKGAHTSGGRDEKADEKMQALSPMDKGDATAPSNQRRLTRAAFSKTLQQHASNRKSVFNIKGLHNLQDTFQALDRSIGTEIEPSQSRVGEEEPYTKVCRRMLKHSEADYEESLIPGKRDISELLTSPHEYLGDEFRPPMTDEQERFFRRFKSIFTSGEDNLLLRGVNLYGEKQWILIADRFLPDRGINVISQRYSKLCVMLYKANGIRVDNRTGDLVTPPKLESVDDIDDAKVALIKKPKPPAILNVHRWSLEEDLALLRAVPFMGHMWAEIGARLIPHRDRGHLRKRYQVLERRAKATVQRDMKEAEPVLKMAAKIRQNHRKDVHRRMMQQQQQQYRQPHPPHTHAIQATWQQAPRHHQVPKTHLQSAQSRLPQPPQRPSTSAQQARGPMAHARAHMAPHSQVQPTSHPGKPRSQLPSQRPVHPLRQGQRQQPQQKEQRPSVSQSHPFRQQHAKEPPSKKPPPAAVKPQQPAPEKAAAKAKSIATLKAAINSQRDGLREGWSSRAASAARKTSGEEKANEWGHSSGMDDMIETEQVEAEIVGTLANMANPVPADSNSARTSPQETDRPGALDIGKATSQGTEKATAQDTERATPDAKTEDSSPGMTTRSGTKRKSEAVAAAAPVVSTRSSKRLAARQSKEVNTAATQNKAASASVSKHSKVPAAALKSPLRPRTRSTPDQDGSKAAQETKKRKRSPDSEESPAVNSTLFAGGDGLEFRDCGSRVTAGESNSKTSISRSRISANDLEVISALNSLSNSSAPPPPTPPTTRQGTRSSFVGNNTRSKKSKQKEEDKSFIAAIPVPGTKDQKRTGRRKLTY